MKLIICLDDKMGMAFNKRRQSRDSAVIADIKSDLDGDALYTDEYSAKLFEGSGCNVKVIESLYKSAQSDYTVFCEREDPRGYSDKTESLCIYRWNRIYPCDVYCTIDLNGYKLVSVCSFAGSSHEKITKEIYVKK